ncbi:MAG: fibronectin type III domain-containing protein [Acidobacteriota bacterium]
MKVRPTPVQDLRLRQIGSDVVLRGEIAVDRGAAAGEGRELRILRMAATDKLRVGAVSSRYLLRQFERHAEVVSSLRGEALERAAPGGRLRALDGEPLRLAERGGPRRYLYSVAIVAGGGERSLLPVPVQIEVAAPPPAPVALDVETAEGEVRLQWRPGGTGEGGAPYNVYRRTEAEPFFPEHPLNPAPIAAPEHVDTAFRYGEAYRYVVRAVAASGRQQRESADSEEVEVRPLDVYPPSSPAGLAVAAEGAVIKVYWFPNSEPDLGGYRVYRREDGGERFVLLGETGPAETSFVDGSAARGVRYHYAVSAFDAATPPNESARSEERSEALPVEVEQAPRTPEGPAEPGPSPE